MRLAMMLLTITEVMVTVANPATIILGRIWPRPPLLLEVVKTDHGAEVDDDEAHDDAREGQQR